MARGLLPIVLAVSLALAGCPGGSPLRAGTAKPAAKPVAVAGVHPVPLAEAQRVVDQKGTAAEIVGKAKLISDHGAGIISNNSGAIISEHGGALISNNGSSLTGKTKYILLDSRDENLLADAQIEVLDGEGHVLVDAQRQPLTAHTDAEGAYRFKAVLPAESLIFRIRLYNGGQLLAIVARDERGKAGDLAIDTASSLGASYVLERYVKNRQAIFDRLPAAEAQALHRDAEVARGQLDGTPTYLPADLTAATDALRAKAKSLDETLVRIASILLAGQQDLGNGKAATDVALAGPYGMASDAAGNLYVAEIGAFRIRRIDAAGKIDVFAGLGARTNGSNQAQTLDAVGALAFGPDGALYVTQIISGKIRRIKPDGTVETFYGETGGPVMDHPTPLSFGPDGTLYVAEVKGPTRKAGRLWSLGKDGKAKELPIPAGSEHGGNFNGLAIRPDGTLLLADAGNDTIYSQAPGGAWQPFATLKGMTKSCRIALGPAGELYVPLADDHKVIRVGPDGVITPFAGSGEGGYAGDGGAATAAKLNQPVAPFCLPDGTVYISDLDGVVRKVAGGAIATFAGTRNVIVGEATTIPLNGPGGMAVDPQGRLVFSEAGSHTIKRLVDGRLEVLAGTAAGFGGDGGPALAAAFTNPAGIAFIGPDLYILDVGNNRVRKVDAAGQINTVVHGDAHVAERDKGPVYAASSAPFDYPLAAASAPDGTLYWTDVKGQQVLHLRADGKVEVIAGTFEKAGNTGDGGPASAALMDSPTGLAFDRAGDLYFCDSHNLCVRKIALSEPGRSITLAVGRTAAALFSALNDGATDGKIQRGDEEGKDAHEVSLFGPAAICFDSADRMYISELGTSKLASFGGASGLPAEILDALPQIGTRVRRIVGGKVYTVAGDGTHVLNDPASDDSMLYPIQMLVDAQGRLILADTALNQIKMLKPDALK
ncbi:MAG: repeat containing protein [Cyanobacteria bacterium RYN_339]|nr:repeat containing protein [Cyanobacteria bacterium RYN_339]